MTKEIVTPQTVEHARSIIQGSLTHPVNGEFIIASLNLDIQSMRGWRILRRQGERPDNPPQGRLVYDQRACEIYRGRVILARDIWEDHNDMRARAEVPPREFRVSGELFYIRDLPKVPVIRCDRVPSNEDLQTLKQEYVLIDPSYKML